MSRISTPKSFISFNASFNRNAWLDIANDLASNTINQIAVDSSGNIYAGGAFISVNGVTANNVARWNGNVWSAMDSGVDGQVLSVLVDNSDNVYVGGFFPNHLARWNGSSWVSIGTSLGNYVQCLATDRANNIYAGGPFGVRVWNGATWTNLIPSSPLSGSIFTIYHDPDPNGEMYVGGFFSSINGVPANNIARFQETTWFPLGDISNNGVNGFVFTIAKGSFNDINIGGAFINATQPNGTIVQVNNYCAWVPALNLFGRIQNGGIIGVNNDVYSIAIDLSSNITYLGGFFSQVTNVPAIGMASLQSGNVQNIGSPFQIPVNSIVINRNNEVFACGLSVDIFKVAKYSNQTFRSTIILPLDKEYKRIN